MVPTPETLMKAETLLSLCAFVSPPPCAPKCDRITGPWREDRLAQKRQNKPPAVRMGCSGLRWRLWHREQSGRASTYTHFGFLGGSEIRKESGREKV